MRPEALVPLAHEALIGLIPVDESEAVTLTLRIQATLFIRAMDSHSNRLSWCSLQWCPQRQKPLTKISGL
jgi:hypothetical protein